MPLHSGGYPAPVPLLVRLKWTGPTVVIHPCTKILIGRVVNLCDQLREIILCEDIEKDFPQQFIPEYCILQF